MTIGQIYDTLTPSFGKSIDEHSLSNYDIYLFKEGIHCQLYNLLGALPAAGQGVRFTVWAPNADHIYVIGDFNDWRESSNRLKRLTKGDYGAPLCQKPLWAIFIPFLSSPTAVIFEQRSQILSQSARRSHSPAPRSKVQEHLHLR